MADPDQQDFDEFDALVDDNADSGDDLSFDKPDSGRKKRQTVFYIVLLAFIGLVLTSVWFVFLRQPETAIQPVQTAETSGDLPPGVVSAENPASISGDAASVTPAIDPVTGQPVAQDNAQAPGEASIVPIDPTSVNPEVATPQIASPEVAAVDNAASPNATVTSTGTTVEALPPPIDPAGTTTADTAAITPEVAPVTDPAVVPAAPEAIAPNADQPAADMAMAPEPKAIEPLTAQETTPPVAQAENIAPVATPMASEATNPAIDQRLAQIEEQVKSIAAAAPAGTTGASPELAEQLKALTEKLDRLTTQVDSLDQRTTNFATELQSRSSDNDRVAPVAPVKKAAAKPVHKPAPKRAAVASWELRSAQPGVAWLGKPGSGEMTRFSVGQTVPGLGTIQEVNQEGGRWIVKTSNGTLRQ